MADTGLPRTSSVVDEDLDDVDFVDDDVDFQVDLVDEKVDAGIAEERLARVLRKPKSISDEYVILPMTVCRQFMRTQSVMLGSKAV